MNVYEMLLKLSLTVQQIKEKKIENSKDSNLQKSNNSLFFEKQH